MEFLSALQELIGLAVPSSPYPYRVTDVRLEDRERPAAPDTADPSAQHLLERLAVVLRASGPIAASQRLEHDLGLDSLDLVSVRLLLEEELGVRLRDEELWRLRTVGDLMARVAGARRPEPRPVDYTWAARVREPAGSPLDERFNLGRRGVNHLFAELGLGIMKLSARLAFRSELVHPERLPQQGPYLLCPNHRSFLDSGLIYAIFPNALIHRTVFVAYGPYFHTPPASWLVRMGRLILTGEGDNVADSLRLAHDALQRGLVACIFPEGVRSPTGAVVAARPGAGLLSCEAQAPIVPVLFQGSQGTYSPTHPGFRPTKIRAIVGHPIPPPAPKAFGKADYQAMADRWRDGVLRLVAEHER